MIDSSKEKLGDWFYSGHRFTEQTLHHHVAFHDFDTIK